AEERGVAEAEHAAVPAHQVPAHGHDREDQRADRDGLALVVEQQRHDRQHDREPGEHQV
ncbi:MAG: hypothetical protein AVDCRST_MAG06-2727, partial [uncultured Nocardioides sp.]